MNKEELHKLSLYLEEEQRNEEKRSTSRLSPRRGPGSTGSRSPVRGGGGSLNTSTELTIDQLTLPGSPSASGVSSPRTLSVAVSAPSEQSPSSTSSLPFSSSPFLQRPHTDLSGISSSSSSSSSTAQSSSSSQYATPSGSLRASPHSALSASTPNLPPPLNPNHSTTKPSNPNPNAKIEIVAESPVLSKDSPTLGLGAHKQPPPPTQQPTKRASAPPVPIFQRKDFSKLVMGGFALAFHAGWINVICLLEYWNQPVAHVTGTISQISVEISRSAYLEAFYHLVLVFSFFLGSFISGVLVGSVKFKFKRNYGLVLILESCFLLVAAAILDFDDKAWWSRIAFLLAAVACGIQNAMCTGFSGAVIRTTHMTGITTDIGLVVGHLARNFFTGKEMSETWKLFVFIPLWIGTMTPRL